VFRQFAKQITAATKGGWNAAEFSAKNGNVFAGEGGEALVFDAAGKMFRGHLQDQAAFIRARGGLEVAYEALKAIP